VAEAEPELIMSPLCQDVTRDGYTVRVDIYRIEPNQWTLEVVDEEGGSTVWNDTFAEDQLALDEFHRTLELEGIRSFEEGQPAN